MTAFARVDAVGDGWRLGMELKSVNNRYCDIHVRLPRWMNGVEETIKKRIKSVLHRGRIDVCIDYRGEGGSRPVFEPDVPLGMAYLSAVRELAAALEMPPDIDMTALVGSVRDVIVIREEHEDSEAVMERIAPHLDRLLRNALEMSRDEGERLEEDIAGRVERIGELLNSVRDRAAVNLEASLARLRERIEKYLDACPVDEARLAQEAVILTDRLDITEEQVRAASHVRQFFNILDSEGPAGRKLDFLLQELFREVNTMASKASDDRISQWVVEIKAELEKIREQVQNVV
jgi:uncharacterized protein (TIGR00255 family)